MRERVPGWQWGRKKTQRRRCGEWKRRAAFWLGVTVPAAQDGQVEARAPGVQRTSLITAPGLSPLTSPGSEPLTAFQKLQGISELSEVGRTVRTQNQLLSWDTGLPLLCSGQELELPLPCPCPPPGPPSVPAPSWYMLLIPAKPALFRLLRGSESCPSFKARLAPNFFLQETLQVFSSSEAVRFCLEVLFCGVLSRLPFPLNTS